MSAAIAQTILAQLGGRQFVAMTGAKDFIGSETALIFRVPKNASKANKCRITLEANDTYTVEFFRLYKLECLPVAEYPLVYADQLRDLFERVTRLHTSLGTMGR